MDSETPLPPPRRNRAPSAFNDISSLLNTSPTGDVQDMHLAAGFTPNSAGRSTPLRTPMRSSVRTPIRGSHRRGRVVVGETPVEDNRGGSEASPLSRASETPFSVFRAPTDNRNEENDGNRLNRPDSSNSRIDSDENRMARVLDDQIHEAEAERLSGQELLKSLSQEISFLVQAFSVFIDKDQGLNAQCRTLLDRITERKEVLRQDTPSVIATRLHVNINSFNHFLHLRDTLKNRPYIGLPALERAIEEKWKLMSSDRKIMVNSPKVAIYGFMHDEQITPRGLSSDVLDKLACVEGVVNKCNVVIPKVREAVYVGENESDMYRGEKSVYIRDMWDVTNFEKSIKDLQPPPQKDPDSDIVYRFEVGLSVYKDRQRFVLQETPESAPTGQMPRSVEVVAENDLVNTVKCGDRVRVWGVYRMNVPKVDGAVGGTFRPYFIANGISNQNLNLESMKKLTTSMLDKYLELSNKPNTIEIIANSVAPSIYGHREIKLGLALMLVGGRHIANNNHKIRGDIHVMLLGDPSCGKSQILRFIMGLMPGSVSATGRGSTGVGLTAAVITDQDTGERRVEGGACVMGDKHIICIDEFDKMRPQDTVAIHEVMEQQTVTVAKAGIHTVLNARCSILAAANPIYGCWSDLENFGTQLNFPQSLMSRFDLVYIVRDTSDEQSDDRITSKVLLNLRNTCRSVSRHAVGGGAKASYSKREGRLQVDIKGYEPLAIGDMNDEDTIDNGQNKKKKNDIQMYVNGGAGGGSEQANANEEILTTDFLRGYVSYCKNDYYLLKAAKEGWEPYPVISDEAHRYISRFYSEIREICKNKYSGGGGGGGSGKIINFITVRTLEGLIRLATAHARIKLRRYVVAKDVNVAISLLKYTVLGEDVEMHSEFGDDDYEDDDNDYEDMTNNKRSKEELDDERTKRRIRRDLALNAARDRQEEEHDSQNPYNDKKGNDEETTFGSRRQTINESFNMHIPNTNSQSTVMEESLSSEAINIDQEGTRQPTPKRLDILFKAINRNCSASRGTALLRILEIVNRSNPDPFGEYEARMAINELAEAGSICFDPEVDEIWLV